MVLHAQFNPVETLRTVERERVNVLFLLPAMWQALALIPDFDEHDLSSLRYLISGGENVYPTEVEQVLYRHPRVQEVAVIGVPDETWGEVPMALVVPKPGERLTLEEMEEFCRDKLARFKTPKHLAETSELPRTATGKILKRELRKQFAET